ncbi:DUF2304 domain-containing protein [Candidatus Falkowbacteria bacterium]|nr:MAG: DUF2304 domain-containing protein [Candidatus Falkowbacteria bacterium]
MLSPLGRAPTTPRYAKATRGKNGAHANININFFILNCMFQQLLALIIIVFFFFRLFWQKRKKQINFNEFIFWLIFWLLSALAIIFLKKIDLFVANLGFSGSGIEVLFYLGIVVLFYLIFRMRIKIEKIEKNITKIVREISLKNK